MSRRDAISAKISCASNATCFEGIALIEKPAGVRAVRWSSHRQCACHAPGLELIEKRLGTPLLRRSTRPPSLTGVGWHYLVRG
jgi:hypothetical protein